MTDQTKEREDFENWLLFAYATSTERDENGDYSNPFASMAWEGWQARASQSSAPAWIDAKERKPERHGTYAAILSSGFTETVYWNGEWWTESPTVPETVDYWFDLPKRPAPPALLPEAK